MDDIFDQDDTDFELRAASREYERSLKSVENSAFHEAFEEAQEKCVQTAFDLGYELIFSPMEILSNLEGVCESLLTKNNQSSTAEDFSNLKSELAFLRERLISDYEEQIKKDLEKKAFQTPEYKGQEIKPSVEIIESFNQVKNNILQLCSTLNLPELMSHIKKLSLQVPST